MKKLIIFGSSGRLGNYLKKKLKNNYKLYAFGRKRNKYEVNLSKRKEIEKVIYKIDPDIIINCAGATDVNKCIKDNNFAYRGNVIIPQNIESVLKKYKKQVHIIHFSTDQVYNSKSKRSLENESNLTNNDSKTKFFGEKKIRKLKNHTIIRTNFYGDLLSKKHKSFSGFIIDNVKRRKKIEVPNNIYFNPIHVKILIKYLDLIIKKKINGTYNIGSENVTSKYDFAVKICKMKRITSEFVMPFKSIYNKDKRPLNTSTNIKKFENKLKNLNLI